MQNPPRRTVSGLLGCAAICALSAPCFAQTTPSATADTSSDIVVTAEATKSDVPLKETPQSVTIIDRAQLDQLNVQTIEEAFRYVPSAQSESGGSRGFDNILIRGFNQSAYEYRDGLRLDPGYVEQQEPYGLERLEVLKGPASVFYGQIAPRCATAACSAYRSRLPAAGGWSACGRSSVRNRIAARRAPACSSASATASGHRPCSSIAGSVCFPGAMPARRRRQRRWSMCGSLGHARAR